MTIASTTNKVRTNGTGAQTVFNFTFPVFSASDLKVYLIDSDGNPTLKELTTHYTVSLDDPGPGGDVTMVTAPAADEELLIVREVELTQTTDIPVRGSLREPQIEFVYDRLTMMIQQLQEQIDRCVKVGVASEISEVPAFPTPVEDNVLGWDGSGNLKNIVLGTAVAAIITTAIATATADAEAAQAAAEAAQAAAELAETNAETAETNAETAETNAEAAQAAAEAAQAAAEAAAAGVNLPSIASGDALKLLRANAGETAFELVAIKDEDNMASDSATHVPSQQSVKAYVDGKIIDEDDMASNSATKVPTQQSVKAYVDGSIPAGVLIDLQVFTANGTWTKPAGCTKALVKVVGGGGGGQSSGGNPFGSSGGGGGGYSEKFITSGLGSTETVTVGAGGGAGSTGGTSSFGAHCSATGGGGASTANTPGSGGVGSGGDINIAGGGGGGGVAFAGSPIGGAGGSSVLGGGAVASQNATGNTGGAYGGGGSGVSDLDAANFTGGSGAGGVVIVYSYT